jgi:radical SAM superfamily enzyme YgiQ (UPF0313 family)
MRICLIFPDWGVRAETKEQFSEFKEYNAMIDRIYNDRANPIYRQAMNSALPIIASCAPDDCDIDIIDDRYEEIDFTNAWDVIGITMMTCQAVRGYEIADQFRKAGVKVAIGGIHPTVLPQEAKAHCDSVFVGEAETTFPQFISDLKQGNPKPYYAAKTFMQMKEVPAPRYELLSNDGQYAIIWMQTSRGCPHGCDYCTITKVNGSKIRSKSIEQIMHEIESIKSHFGNSLIGFSDDNMLARSNREAAKSILKAIIPAKIRWYASTDVSIADDDELLDLAAKSGCRVLIIGFESLSVESLENINRSKWKYKQLDNYANVIQKIQSKGIGVLGSFMFGLDGDNEDTFKQTRDFIVDTNMYANGINVVTPFPGTRLRQRYLKEKRVLPTGWDNYTKTGINIIPKKMSIQRIADNLVHLLESLYFDNDILFKKLKYFRELAKQNSWT